MQVTSSRPPAAVTRTTGVLSIDPGSATVDQDAWSLGTSGPTSFMSFEDLLVYVFALLLEREAHGIAKDAAAIAEAAQAYAESGDLNAIDDQKLTEARLALRTRVKDREHLFTLVLAILESLNATARQALESMGK